MPKGPKTPTRMEREQAKRSGLFRRRGDARRRKRAAYLLLCAVLLSLLAFWKPFTGVTSGIVSVATVLLYAYGFFLLLW